MKNPFVIALKETKEPTLWERFVQWVNADSEHPERLVMQVPKTGTNTEILLSQTQKIKLKDAVESPGAPSSETSFATKADSNADKPPLFI